MENADRFRYGAFLAAMLLILGGWKFGVESMME